MKDDQVAIARAWLNVVAREVDDLEKEGIAKHAVGRVLALTKGKTIEWQEDKYWDEVMRMCSLLAGER